MTEDDLKLYTAMVGSGSGCFFQPMTRENTYVLSARHLFCDEVQAGGGNIRLREKADGQAVLIIQNIFSNGRWTTQPIPLTLERGRNYFPHDEADAAILKIPFTSGFDQITVSKDLGNLAGYSVCGYPTNRRNGGGDPYTLYRISHSLASNNDGHSAQLQFGTLGLDHIEGMSGGGIIKPDVRNISIMGVQSKMASMQLPAGQIGFVPMKYFDEIIEGKRGQLERLLPVFLKSFLFLADDIFNINFGYAEQEVGRHMTTILKLQAVRIMESDITPHEIINFFKARLLLITANQDNSVLEQREVWAAWLELLTILNIIYSQNHTLADLPALGKRIRLFYSHIERDFFMMHLGDLAKHDYSGLEKGGCVIVSSRIGAQGQGHVLNPDKIPGDISRSLRKDHEALSIDSASDFPFDRYKFMNISAFKEHCVEEICHGPQEVPVAQYIEKLRELYGSLITA